MGRPAPAIQGLHLGQRLHRGSLSIKAKREDDHRLRLQQEGSHISFMMEHDIDLAYTSGLRA